MAIAYPALASVGQNSTSASYQKGSPNAVFRLVNGSTGAALDSALYVMPLIKDSSLEDTTAENKLSDEGGNTYTSDGDREMKVSFTLMQGDMNAQSLPTLLAGSYAQIMKEESREGTPYYTLYGIVKMSKTISRKKPGNEVVVSGTVVSNTSALSIASADFATSIFASTLTGSVIIPSTTGYRSFTV